MANPGIAQLTPRPIHVGEAELADLRQRLINTRWPFELGNEDWYYGVNLSYLQDLVQYWLKGFDWRAREADLNAFAHYRVEIDRVPVHFLHAPGKGPAPIPLILNHGWPWTFWDWHRVLGPLSDPAAHGGDPEDAFDLIVPSIPGFGFSTPHPHVDMTFSRMADILHQLMKDILGNRRYAAGGGDIGALITGQFGHQHARDLYGIYLTHGVPLDAYYVGERPWDATNGQRVPEGAPPEIRARIIELQQRFAAHMAVQILEPETLAYGLTDSPVGLLAWLLQRWRSWSDHSGDVENAFSRDHMLINTMIWWSSKAISTCFRTYSNGSRYPWVRSHDRMPSIEAPAGFTFLGYENPPGVTTEERVDDFLRSPAARVFNPVYLRAHERGGHFAPVENPAAVVEDIRATFRPLR